MTRITKEEIMNAIARLPDDASVADAMGVLYVLYKIDRGLADIEAGRVVSQEEARERMRRWLA